MKPPCFTAFLARRIFTVKSRCFWTERDPRPDPPFFGHFFPTEAHARNTPPPLGWWLVAGGGWLVTGGWLGWAGNMPNIKCRKHRKTQGFAQPSISSLAPDPVFYTVF